MSHPYFTPSVVHGYGTLHITGMSFTPSMSNEPATPTFVLETQLSDRESPIEVLNLEKVVSNAEGTRKCSSWTKVEDEVLARSFVTISDDQIIDNDQKGDAFWGRVASYYNENLPLGSNTRSANVIRSHWHNTIQKKVYRFNANYNSVYISYRSGHSDEDILRFAYEKYRSENNGIAFNLEHVWRIVKDRPMFTPQFADHFVVTKKTRTSKSGANNTSPNQDVSIDLDYEDTRPMGQKATKRKGKDKVKSTMEDLTRIIQHFFNIGTMLYEEKGCHHYKCTSAIRQLAYGVPADHLDEYLRMGESTAIRCLFKFYEYVVEIFGDRYLEKAKC
ncbi:glutathione S-transferase T3-like [Zingiber officinale]|uniref:glutathione S-transferase T3-like n=1 Tax=Zingiber officinale TaxID=94328 RepID=UPI001C4CF084|nr:glutathione S-transferase T3-like [Zingiber officinale]